MARTVSAAWPTDCLVRSLAVSGWGILAARRYQGVRATLRALVDELPHGSGEGMVTAYKISRSTGHCDRWTRECLKALEELGVISWTRGGIVNGRAQASFIRIIKKRLVALIRDAKEMEQAVRREYRARVAERCKHFQHRTVFAKRDKQNPSIIHAELSSRNTPLTGGGLTPSPHVDIEKEPLRGAAYHKKPQLRLERAFTVVKEEKPITTVEAHYAWEHARLINEQRKSDKHIQALIEQGYEGPQLLEQAIADMYKRGILTPVRPRKVAGQ